MLRGFMAGTGHGDPGGDIKDRVPTFPTRCARPSVNPVARTETLSAPGDCTGRRHLMATARLGEYTRAALNALLTAQCADF